MVDVLKKIWDFLAEYLRINAIRRMLGMVDVKRREIWLLIALAIMFAAFEGVGLSLLLPILQFAESGSTAITDGQGAVWQAVNGVMQALNLPVTLPVLLVLAFVPILLRQVVFYINTWYSAVVSSRIAIRLRMQTLDTILEADSAYFSEQTVGYLVGIIMGQTSAAGQAILAVLRQLSLALLMVLYAAIMMAISVPLTLTTLVFAVLVSMVVRRSITRIRDYGIEATDISQDMMSKIVERLGLMRLIKLRDQKATESERIEKYSELMRVIGIKQARLGALIEVTADPLLMLSVFVTLYIGISVLGMSLAQLGLLLFVVNRLNAKVKEFNAGLQVISTNMAGLLLVKITTDNATRANTIRGGTVRFEGLKHGIALHDVSFEYPWDWDPENETNIPPRAVLRDISLTIPAGSFTAIVGRSGAGKSTLVELLPRLRDVTGGSITLDGVDIREFQLGSLRSGVGYLTQSAMLFNDTIRENLVYGMDHEPTDEEMRSALERAYASFVYDLPDGLETRVGDRGVRFSGGERQRISLARTLLEDTSIIILDEPTSALDSESERFIQDAMTALHGVKTVIVIAHRLATVIQADQLLVIEDGRVAERGTHSELVARNGSYRKLFDTQLLTSEGTLQHTDALEADG